MFSGSKRPKQFEMETISRTCNKGAVALDLTDLTQAARGLASQEAPRETCPFDRLATKLGLPTNCDIDLRRQEEMEVTPAALRRLMAARRFWIPHQTDVYPGVAEASVLCAGSFYPKTRRTV